MNMREKRNRTFARTAFLVRTVMSAPGIVFVYTPLAVLTTAAGIAAPFATGRFIDALVSRSAPWNAFAALAALLLFKAAMTPCLQTFILARARKIELALQERVLSAVMDLPSPALSVLNSGELVAKLTRDAYAVGGFVSGLYPRLLAAFVTMASAGFALHSRSPILAAAFAAFIPLSITLFLPFAGRFAKNSRAVRQRGDRSFAALFDFFVSLPFLRLMDAERRFADAPRESLRAFKRGNCATDRLTIVFGTLLGAILVLGEISVLAVSGVMAAKGEIPVGDVVVYQMLFLAAMQSVQGIVSLLPETSTLREGIDSLGEILSRPAQERGGTRPGAIGRLEFRDVTFSYPNSGEKPVISAFSHTFRSGKSVAVTGANGTGKTTLLKLAIGALEPQSGEVLADGIPLGKLDQGFFRRSVGAVLQESLVVTGTIRDNITLRDPSFTETDVRLAVEESGLGDVLANLPQGLDTRVGMMCGASAGGVRSLSGGEIQRLAIARAIVRKPSILVLDEVTNHLDAEARRSFGRLMKRLASGRIVLLVTHDEELADMCDEKISCQI